MSKRLLEYRRKHFRHELIDTFDITIDILKKADLC